eukprot:TRINITY_DN2809_c0_g1_i1.p1 TRINITY_DN2809_c0_g1~~TRINITY_DN2809_c0_g1_i1.p1  ORF type:complete len:196 (+),score=38.59 TRINITY_DN2809_c0_g1_i1:60-647(+)
MQASNVPKSQLLILLRRGPYMLYFFASLAVFLVVVGLALDIYTRAECDNGIKYLFGWDTVGADPGRDLSYADCDNRDECKDLMSAGKSTVAMGIMTIFTTLTAIWVYKSSSAQVSRRGQFFSIFLLVLSSLFSFLHFMIWAVEGNDAAKEFVLEDCTVKLYASADLAIAAFFFLLISTLTRVTLAYYEVPYSSVE